MKNTAKVVKTVNNEYKGMYLYIQTVRNPQTFRFEHTEIFACEEKLEPFAIVDDKDCVINRELPVEDAKRILEEQKACELKTLDELVQCSWCDPHGEYGFGRVLVADRKHPYGRYTRDYVTSEEYRKLRDAKKA